jgi:putative flippase GtrA
MRFSDDRLLGPWIGNILFNRSNNTLIQMFRYAVVALVAFVVDFTSLYLLTAHAGLYYLFSAAIAFTLGLATNFLLSVRWVFVTRTVENKSLEFFIFGTIGLVGLGLTEVLMWLLTEQVGLYYLVSKMISTCIVFFWNFLVRKFLLFRDCAERRYG